MEQASSSAVPGTAPAIKKKSHWLSLLWFSLIIVIYFLGHFAYQYYYLLPGNLDQSLVRSFALSGATLLAAALFSSVIFRLLPKTAKHWRWRRRLGVAGFVLICFHFVKIVATYFNFDFTGPFRSDLNPFSNPTVFGLIAFVILLVMAITSTDKMVTVVGSKRWKFIHRFIYIAFLAAIFHFVSLSWYSLQNPLGYVLLGLSALTIIGHIYLFFRTIIKRKFPKVSTIVGLLIIGGGIVAGYKVYLDTFKPLPKNTLDLQNTTTYHNTDYKFKIGYHDPLVLLTDKSSIQASGYIPLCDAETSVACLIYPDNKFPSSNFNGAAVSVSVITEYNSSESCNSPHNGEQLANIKNMTLNDAEFTIFRAGDAALSHYSSAQRYRTWHNNRCIQLETRFNTTNPDVYDPGAITVLTAANQSAIYDSLIRSLISFTFDN